MAYVPTSLHKKIRSHLVLIIDTKTYENGSGVLVQMENRIFVLTAAHVITDNLHINLGLPFQQSPFSILDKWIDTSLDIGFIELKPFEVEIMRHDEATPYRIQAKKEIVVHERVKTLALCGYPTIHHKIEEKSVSYTPAFIGCALLSSEHWPTSLHECGKTRERNFAILYGQKHAGRFYDPDKNPIDPIPPKGMSGCGLWFFDPENEHADNPTYSLVGIQHSHFPQDQVVVGTFAEFIVDAICNKYGFSLKI
jgi:hypothetical protein